jgi:aspartyl/glutamyl-tRNA(Asn/Gln) amidotransferase B subunit
MSNASSAPQHSTDLPNGWEMVVGLEVHVELDTKTKLFSASPNRFGDEPNTNIDPVTLGLPGALPVLNKHAVELAIRLGLALNCTVQPSTFHRKNYFYQDMPKAYQISQYDQPINIDGFMMLPGDVRIGIERAHLEEDTGKSTHIGGTSGRIHGSDYSLVDFNRAGVPLVEIVSRPDIRNSDQARQYVAELRSILLAVGASDAKMEEGSMRCDVNVSVRKPGAPFGTRCEIKNVNSIRAVGKAIDYEARRQIDVLESGGTIRQETRHWDDGEGRTHTLRSKEDADDYRYFLEIRNGLKAFVHRCQCCLPHVARNLHRSPARIRKANRCTSLSNAGKTIMYLPLRKQVVTQRVHWYTCNKHLQKKVQLQKLQQKILQRSRKWNAMQKSLRRKQKRFCRKWWPTVEETQLLLRLRKVSKHSTPAR